MAKKPGHARSGSYRADDVTPIERAGLYTGVEGSRELLPGLVMHVLGGHSDGVSVITLNESGPGECAIFWGDVVRSFEVRSKWLERAANERWIGLFYHDADHAFGRLVKDGKRYRVELV